MDRPVRAPAPGYVSYDSFHIDVEQGALEFSYGYNDVERFVLRVRLDLRPARDPAVLRALSATVFALGHALLSYVYVAFCTTEIRVRAGYLDEAQVAFWHAVFEGGLMEHFYVKGIPWGGLRIVVEAPPSARLAPADLPLPAGRRVLVPLGGGKDSSVLIELLREAGAEVFGCYFEEYLGELGALAPLAGYAKVATPDGVHLASQELVSEPALREASGDPEILEYTLYPSLYALTGVLFSLMHGYRYIAVGNERSANFGNAVHGGFPVNHQYEKSFAFESAFHAYCRRYLAPEIHYFSGLMHLWEIQIVERFARHPKYFPVLLSCNKPVAQSWCRRCPKCAVTYLLLSAFVDPAEVQAIFGEELFARAELEPAFQAILGVVGDKPLECVCTPEEAVLAARRAAQRIAAAGAPLPGLLARALAGTAAVVIDEAALLGDHNEENLLPSWFAARQRPARAVLGEQETAVRRDGGGE